MPEQLSFTPTFWETRAYLMKPTGTLLLFRHSLKQAVLLCICTLFVAGTLHAQAPVPQFSASTTAGCAPLLVNFTDQSTGGATAWQWDLGNGTTSTQQNPSTVYFTPGSYTVTLTVTNASGSRTLTRTNYITVNALPTTEFSADNRNGCFPLRVQFTDLTDPGFGTITSWNWSFGNGATSTLQNPFYVYTTSGTYFVSLTVTNSAGCSRTMVKPAFINVSQGIIPNFTVAAPRNCRPPESISFTNTTIGPGTLSYEWDFGDGNSSTATNPNNNYTTPGPFTVRLITRSSLGCVDTLTRTNAVLLNNLQTAMGAPATACIREIIPFQNQSVPLPVSSVWTFGDGTTSTQTNPTKAYSSIGTFTVRLVNQYAVCRDSVTQTITINPRPTASFSSTDTISCRAPHTVSFTDASANAVSWNWNFGDGNTSTLQNPVHTYTALGNYTVRLVVTNNLGCTDTLTRVNYIRLQRPVFNPIINPSEGCRILNVQFLANTTAVDSIASWFWDFGNGVTSTLRNPSATYDSGTYSVKLRVVTVQGCVDSIVLNNRIRTGTRPTAAFSATPVNVCAFAPLQFNDLSTGNPDQWSWTFGDGNTSNLQNPVHTYRDTGTFTIRLTVFNNRCPDTSTITGYIRVLPPIARFTYAVNCTINKRQVSFTDQSTSPLAWSWNFGDGNSSSAQNPTHLYASLGTYTVTLTATNGGCSHSVTQTIRLVDERPAFTANRVTICKNESIQFTGTVPNASNIVAWNWNFGDGGTGTGPTPTYTYPNAGTYTVRLVVTDINNCRDTLVQTNYIRVNGPTAAFTQAPPRVCLGSDVSFSNTSATDGVNPITLSTWDLGNSVRTTTADNPFVYTYPAAGSYSVKLIVQDAAGCRDSITRANAVTVLFPRARFRVDTPSCPGAVMIFVNQTTGTSVPSYRWEFGDGATSTSVNPSHIYTNPGTYTVKLVITESIGCRDSFQMSVRIARPVASFTVNDSISICQPFQARFINTSTFASSYEWNLGDGTFSNAVNAVNFYTLPGAYRVRLRVTSPGGCTDSAFRTIRIGTDTGTLTYAPLTACAPLTVNLQVRTSVPLTYTWDLGDGNLITTTDSNLTHTYQAGFYVPKVILRDGSNCFGTIEGIDTIKAFGSRPDFKIDDSLFCDNGTVQFTDSTSTPDIITGYSWNFGDGGTSTLQNPSHFYAAAGLYTVSLTVRTQSGCVNTITKPNLIKVVASPRIAISGDTSYCMPAGIQLQGLWLNADTSTISWRWDIDGRNFNTQNTPVVPQPTADTLLARLYATSASGCIDSTQRMVIVRPLPAVFAGFDTTICLGTAATLRPSGAVSFVWNAAPSLSCTNCTNPLATPSSATQYVVTGTSAFGCRNSDSVLVRVKTPFRVAAAGSDTLCVGESVQLLASGAEFYNWTPPTGLNDPTIPNPIASPTTTTIYRLIGTDSLNCFNDSAFVRVVVYNYPVLNAGADTTISAGSTIRLQSAVSTDATSVLWTPAYNLSCTSCSSPFASPLRTTRYRLTATNLGGCASFDEVVVSVNCSKEDVYVPNAFTPNGDNVNDYFYIIGRGLQSIKSLRVYNRWGNLVFERTYFDPSNRSLGWDGTYKGQQLPPGTYTYTAEALCGDGAIIPLSGIINLIR